MAREEEINNYAKKDSEELYDSLRQNGLDILTSRSFQHIALSYIVRGAKWADQTIIDRACKFLKSYRQETPDGMGYIAGIVNDKTIDDLRKAMQDG